MSVSDPQKESQDLVASKQEIAELKAELRTRRGAGGTPGGVGTFLIGLLMAVAGGYLILNQVSVTTTWSYWGLWGWSRPGGFGLTMLPMLVGIGLLFVDGKSKAGWALTIGGAVIILLAILMNMSLVWERTSLFHTVLMFGMLAAGLGLIFRSLRPYPT